MTLLRMVIGALCVLSIFSSSVFADDVPALPVEVGKRYTFGFPQYTEKPAKIRISPRDPFLYAKVLEIRGNWVHVHAYADREAATVSSLLDAAKAEDGTVLEDYLDYSKMTKDEVLEKLATVKQGDIMVRKMWINLSLVLQIAEFAPPKKADQPGGADQPGRAPDGKPEGEEKPQPKAE